MHDSPFLPQTNQYTRLASSVEQPILVVDDQQTILFFLRGRLEKFGFSTFMASNGMEGMIRIQEHSFHDILLDLEMPIMNGLAMLHQLRQQANTIPAIAMSADPSRTTMIKEIKSDAKDYLIKPLSFEVLQYKCFRLFL